MEVSERYQDPRFFAKHPWLEYVFIFSAVMGQILTQAGSNYILSLLKVLTNFFDASDGERTWFMSSFSLATGTLILMTGRLGDVLGLKRAIIGGYVCTIIFSLLSGFAYYVRNPSFFIVARAFQGAGVSFILPNILGATGRIYRPGTRRKHWIFSIVGFASPIGGCLGPIFAGLIAVKTKQWNWICYSYTIASLIGLILAWISVPDFESERGKMAVDWIGCGLGFVSLTLFNFVWNQAPNAPGGWKEPYIIALLVVSVCLLVFFVWYELHVPSNPLLPTAVIRDPRLNMSLVSMFLSWGSWGIAFYRFFVFLLYLRNYTPLAAGAALTPAFIFGTIAAFTCGISVKYVPVHFLLVISMAVFVGGDLLLVTLPVHQTYFKQSMGIFILAVFGMDFSFPAASIILSDALPPKQQGMSGSLVLTTVNYGMSICLGIAGTIEQQTLLRHAGDILAAHKACMWFAVGLSSASVLAALVLCLCHWLHDRKARLEAEKTQHDPGSFGYAGELENSFGSDTDSRTIESEKKRQPSIEDCGEQGEPVEQGEQAEKGEKGEKGDQGEHCLRTYSGRTIPEELLVPPGPAIMTF